MSHNIREIYTKAIVAKGKKLSRNTYNFTLSHLPDDILGCWITNHHYEAAIKIRFLKLLVLLIFTFGTVIMMKWIQL